MSRGFERSFPNCAVRLDLMRTDRSGRWLTGLPLHGWRTRQLESRLATWEGRWGANAVREYQRACEYYLASVIGTLSFLGLSALSHVLAHPGMSITTRCLAVITPVTLGV